MDYVERLLNALSNPDHIVIVGFLLVGLFAFAKYIFPRMLKGELHIFFNNGGGDLIKSKIRQELEEQDERFKDMLRDHQDVCKYR